MAYQLSGILYCTCGHRLSGKSAHGNGGKIAYYDHAWAAKISGAVDNKEKLNCNPVRVLANKIEPIVWASVKDFLLQDKFFTEILLEAKNLSELNTPKAELDRKQTKIYEINMQLDGLSERLGILPKAVNPKHVFNQMEKLSISKASLELEIEELGSVNKNKNIVSVDDFNLFKQTIMDLLENEASPEIKSQIIQKVVDRIIVKSDSIEIYFFVGESHYKKEIIISNQQGAGTHSLSPLEKRHTAPLPVFQGNPKTSEFLFLKPNLTDLTPNFFYDAGSNSLKNGSERRT